MVRAICAAAGLLMALSALAAGPLEAVKATGIDAGLAVLAGLSEPEPAFALARGGRFAVVAVAPDTATAERWRTAASQTKLAIPLLIQEPDSLPELPCWSGHADLVVLDADALGALAPVESELRRVLVPGGAAWVRRAGEWTMLRQPEDPRLGNWGQNFCDGSRNPVSADQAARAPTGVRWLTGPRGRTGADPLRIGGRYVVSMLGVRDRSVVGQQLLLSRGHTPPRLLLACRLAHNGVPLWQGREDWMALRRQVSGDGKDLIYAIADGELLTAEVQATANKLAAFSLADGTHLRIYHELPPLGSSYQADIAIDRGRIAVTCDGALWLARQDTAAVLWKQSPPEGLAWYFPAISGNYVLVVEGEREGKSEYERKWGRSRDSRYRDFPCKAVVAFDAASGRQLWRWNNPGHEFERRAWTVNQLAIAGDAAYLFRTTGQSGDVKACYWVACLELADGKQRWHIFPESAYVTEERGVKCLWHPDGAIYKMGVLDDRVFLIGGSCHMVRDAKTGRILYHLVPGNTQCPGPGFSRNLVARGAGYYFDPTKPELPVTHSWLQRGPCASMTYIARGLVFYPASNCSCYRMLYQTGAQHSDPPPPPLPVARRLYQAAAPPSPKAAHGEDWPTLLGTPRRWAAATTRLPQKPRRLWSQAVATLPEPTSPLVAETLQGGSWNGPVTAPVVADGIVLASCPTENRVKAIAFADGRPLWNHVTAARVDAPPTWHAGLAIFGDDAGYVTAVEAATGKVVWRHYIARTHRVMIHEGRPTSSWPVCGSVLVSEGVAVAAAGRHADADGGIRVVGLDPATGRQKWATDLGEPQQWYPFNSAEHKGVRAPTRPGLGNKIPTEVTGGLPFAAGPSLVGIPGMVLRASDGQPQESFFFKAYGSSSTRVRIAADRAQAPWLTEFHARPPTVNQLANHAAGTGERSPVCIVRTDVLPDGKPYMLQADGSGLMASTDRRFVCVHHRNGNLLMAMDWGKHSERDPAWTTPIQGMVPLALCIAGEEVLVGGVARLPDLDRPWLPVPGVLARYRLADGAEIDRLELAAAPVQHGIAVARGRIVIACQDGSVVCLGE